MQATIKPGNPGANPRVVGIMAAIISSDDLNSFVVKGSQSSYFLKMTRPIKAQMPTMRIRRGPLRYKATFAWRLVGKDK